MSDSKGLSSRGTFDPEQRCSLEKRSADWLRLVVGLALVEAFVQTVAGGTVGYSDFGRYLIATEDLPGPLVVLKFHGPTGVLEPGWYREDPTVSNVTFHGHIVMQPGGVPFL